MKKQNSAIEVDFFNAIKNNKKDKVAEFLSQSPALLEAFDYSCFGGTPLNICSFDVNREIISLLLSKGADPNRKSDWWAGGWNPVQNALSCGNENAARFFIDNGAAIGVHEAAGLSMIDELRNLLIANPDLVKDKGGDGCTALHFAGSIEAIDVLIEFGADINVRDIDHHSTPSQYLANHHPKLTKYLFDKGAEADIFTVVLTGDVERFDSMITANQSLLHQRINQKTFPPGDHKEVQNILTFIVGSEANLLHTAAIGKQTEMIDKLVSLGIDINSTGGYDESTALHMSAWNNTLDVTKALLKHNPDIDKRSGKIHNNTPAGWAIVGGSADVFCCLIENGAKVQDYFESDIRAGLNGEFMKYKRVPVENFKRMLEKI